MPAMTFLLVYLFGKKLPGSSAPCRFLALLGSVLLSFLGLLLASLAARFVDVRSAGWGQRQSAAAVISADGHDGSYDLDCKRNAMRSDCRPRNGQHREFKQQFGQELCPKKSMN